jgi:endogenous inhibitor of DNA gyrase (YacG/DUF329 family)
MIKVLEHGIRKVTCPNCKAKLQYEQEDIKIITNSNDFGETHSVKYITCPDCEKEVILTPIKR